MEQLKSKSNFELSWYENSAFPHLAYFVSALMSGGKELEGIRKSHFRICYFGIRIILSCKQLRNSRHRRTLCCPPFYLKARHPLPLVKVSPALVPGRGEQLITRDRVSTKTSLHKHTLLKQHLSFTSSFNLFPIYFPTIYCPLKPKQRKAFVKWDISPWV